MTSDLLVEMPQVRPCPHCQLDGVLRVFNVTTDESPDGIEIERCLMCDTRKCPKCDCRTFAGDADTCKHCDAPIGVNQGDLEALQKVLEGAPEALEPPARYIGHNYK